MAIDDGGAAERAKAEFVLGEQLLAKGNWGYSKPSWEKEFDDLRDAIGVESVTSSHASMANTHR